VKLEPERTRRRGSSDLNRLPADFNPCQVNWHGPNQGEGATRRVGAKNVSRGVHALSMIL
jgi:hypothetical protein